MDLSLPSDTKVPDHIAIIPDGNRRWARSRGLPTFEGHRKGFDAAVKLCKTARQWGVHTVTLWGFSTENWDRSEEEVGYLMKLYEKLIADYLKDAMKDGVKLVHLGRKDRLPKSLIKSIAAAEEKTKNNTNYIMNVAIDYGGHNEIIRATKRMMDDGVTSDVVSKEMFEKYLDTHDQPYPYVDLLIRTSGEQRTSGLLLWQMEYAEYYWEQDHFPDFTPEKLRSAILDYSRRRRRFGGNDAVEHFKFKPELSARLEVAWWRLSNIPEGVAFRDYAMKHLKEVYGLSKNLAKEAAVHMGRAFTQRRGHDWERAKHEMSAFYKVIKGELKLAFEPSIVASLEVKLWKDMDGKQKVNEALEVEDVARELYAEVYRISLFQAAKLAHLRVMAKLERNLAESGMGDYHWDRAEDYLQKFYQTLKDRVA